MKGISMTTIYPVAENAAQTMTFKGGKISKRNLEVLNKLSLEMPKDTLVKIGNKKSENNNPLKQINDITTAYQKRKKEADVAMPQYITNYKEFLQALNKAMTNASAKYNTKK